MNPDPLLELYESTNRDVRVRGRRWYPEARRRLNTLAQRHDRPLSQVVAVFAITSVAAQLMTNLRWTEEILRGEREGGRWPNVQAPLVKGALEARYPSRYVQGPKVSAFYQALMGDTQAVVLDRWALRAAGVEVNKTKHDIGVRVRRDAEAAFRKAAEEVGEKPRNFQAIVWLALRESMPKEINGRVVVPKLRDITHPEVSQDSEIGGTP